MSMTAPHRLCLRYLPLRWPFCAQTSLWDLHFSFEHDTIPLSKGRRANCLKYSAILQGLPRCLTGCIARKPNMTRNAFAARCHLATSLSDEFSQLCQVDCRIILRKVDHGSSLQLSRLCQSERCDTGRLRILSWVTSSLRVTGTSKSLQSSDVGTKRTKAKPKCREARCLRPSIKPRPSA